MDLRRGGRAGRVVCNVLQAEMQRCREAEALCLVRAGWLRVGCGCCREGAENDQQAKVVRPGARQGKDGQGRLYAVVGGLERGGWLMIDGGSCNWCM